MKGSLTEADTKGKKTGGVKHLSRQVTNDKLNTAYRFLKGSSRALQVMEMERVLLIPSEETKYRQGCWWMVECRLSSICHFALCALFLIPRFTQ